MTAILRCSPMHSPCAELDYHRGALSSEPAANLAGAQGALPLCGNVVYRERPGSFRRNAAMQMWTPGRPRDCCKSFMSAGVVRRGLRADVAAGPAPSWR
jgi:hypothetical protein